MKETEFKFEVGEEEYSLIMDEDGGLLCKRFYDPSYGWDSQHILLSNEAFEKFIELYNTSKQKRIDEK